MWCKKYSKYLSTYSLCRIKQFHVCLSTYSPFQHKSLQMVVFTNLPCYAWPAAQEKCSNVQMLKCSNTQMLKCSNTQMLKYSNAQMLKCLNAQMLSLKERRLQNPVAPIGSTTQLQWAYCICIVSRLYLNLYLCLYIYICLCLIKLVAGWSRDSSKAWSRT